MTTGIDAGLIMANREQGMQESALRFATGDRVRHGTRPEWGIGLVTRADDVPGANGSSQRLVIRFPNAGQKTINASVAPLERVEGDGAPADSDLNPFDESHSEGWLRNVAAQKREEHMTALPMEATDPFATPQARLGHTLALFRFEQTPRGLIDWAVAQSQLDDPLSHFSRHELEELFDRWCMAREAALRDALKIAVSNDVDLPGMLGEAPSAARDCVRHIIEQR